MFPKLFFVILTCNILMCVWCEHVRIYNYYDDSLVDILRSYYDIYTNKTKVNINNDQVDVKLYYECLCPDCIRFDTGKFKEAILKFGDHIKISTYPYGNAKTMINNGTVTFKCQHGLAECYGNMLHACALDIVQNQTEALLYNSCMMEDSQNNRGSDDEAADKCADIMNLDSESIKECAKGMKGTKLLQHYGEESVKVNFKYVPYILVNSKETDEDAFINDICNAFEIPPPECQ